MIRGLVLSLAFGFILSACGNNPAKPIALTNSNEPPYSPQTTCVGTNATSIEGRWFYPETPAGARLSIFLTLNVNEALFDVTNTTAQSVCQKKVGASYTVSGNSIRFYNTRIISEGPTCRGLPWTEQYATYSFQGPCLILDFNGRVTSPMIPVTP